MDSWTSLGAWTPPCFICRQAYNYLLAGALSDLKSYNREACNSTTKQGRTMRNDKSPLIWSSPAAMADFDRVRLALRYPREVGRSATTLDSAAVSVGM